MKILAVRLQNLNSLRGEWLIDFRQPPFDSTSLFAIVGPTGAGKTRMGEWALQKAALNGHRGVYLAPLKAIVEEKTRDWVKRYPELSTVV